MVGDFSIFGRIKLAFEVMKHWETLVTLGAFIVLWLLMSFISDPWRNAGRAPRMHEDTRTKKTAPKVASDDLGADDELPE